jgi:tripartite-type tricarboxylate transporter receptor subunit TctC
MAHGGLTPVPVLPGVPTMAEAVPGFEAYEWNGVFAPAGTPAPIVERLNVALNTAIADAATAQRMQAIGCLVRPNTPAQFGEFLDAEIAKWGRIVREGNIKVE